jgi:hypothetical protein
MMEALIFLRKWQKMVKSLMKEFATSEDILPI